MDIAKARCKHHAWAMLVAHGLDSTQIEEFAHIRLRRTEVMLNDPTFRELVAYYRGGGQFKDMKGALKDKGAQ
jgi:hypothetical protein